MATAESVKAKLLGLIAKANEATGNEDTDLTAAVDALIAGFGQGGVDNDVVCRLISGETDEITDEIAPGITKVNDYLFYKSKNLVRFQSSTVEEVGYYSFREASKLETLVLPKLNTISGSGAFRETALVEFVAERLSPIPMSCFESTATLRKVDLHSATSLNQWVFYGCSALETVIIRSSRVPTLAHTNAFGKSGIEAGTGYIYVPAVLVDSYKAATNWSTYADQFRAIEDYPEITGG